MMMILTVIHMMMMLDGSRIYIFDPKYWDDISFDMIKNLIADGPKS